MNGKLWEAKSATTVPNVPPANCKFHSHRVVIDENNVSFSDLVKKLGQDQADKVFAQHWCVYLAGI